MGQARLGRNAGALRAMGQARSGSEAGARGQVDLALDELDVASRGGAPLFPTRRAAVGPAAVSAADWDGAALALATRAGDVLVLERIKELRSPRAAAAALDPAPLVAAAAHPARGAVLTLSEAGSLQVLPSGFCARRSGAQRAPAPASAPGDAARRARRWARGAAGVGRGGAGAAGRDARRGAAALSGRFRRRRLRRSRRRRRRLSPRRPLPRARAPHRVPRAARRGGVRRAVLAREQLPRARDQRRSRGRRRRPRPRLPRPLGPRPARAPRDVLERCSADSPGNCRGKSAGGVAVLSLTPRVCARAAAGGGAGGAGGGGGGAGVRVRGRCAARAPHPGASSPRGGPALSIFGAPDL